MFRERRPPILLPANLALPPFFLGVHFFYVCALEGGRLFNAVSRLTYLRTYLLIYFLSYSRTLGIHRAQHPVVFRSGPFVDGLPEFRPSPNQAAVFRKAGDSPRPGFSYQGWILVASSRLLPG